jgi:type II secretory pathway component PulC
VKWVALKLLLILALSFAGVKIWYGRLEERLRIPPAPAQDTAGAPEVIQTEIPRQPDDYTIIVDRNIFQAVITKADIKEAEPAPEAVAPTTLQLSLMGTISGSERDARAIISDDKKKQQDIYQIGDSIQGALIKTIERGRVVLLVNGADEELLLKDREGGGPAYEPPAGDFAQEPEPPPEIPVAPDAEQPVGQPEPEAPQPQTLDAGLPPGTLEGPVPIEPVVRPRPHRRPLRAPNAGTIQPGSAGAMNVDTEKY